MGDDFNMKQQVDELGKFISKWHWKIWATFSFSNRFSISNHYLESQWDRLVSHIKKLQGTEPFWVRSIEFGAEQGVPHLHALIGGTDIPPREIPRLWHPRTGNAQAETYDPEKRAAWYIAKNPEAVEFSENLLPPTTAHIEEVTSARKSN